MKTTKKARRIIAFAAALSLSACMMAMPVGTTPTIQAHEISINGTDAANHKFEAYQIFSGTYANDGTDAILSNLEFGSGVNSTNLISALNTKDDSPLKGKLDSVTEASALAEKLSSVTGENDIKKIAEIVGGNLNTKAADSESGKFNLNDGYYFIRDIGPTAAGSSGYAYSSFILKVAGSGETITMKSSAPTVVKKVKEDNKITGVAYNNEDGYNDVADYSIGEAVPFKLYGKMPSNIDEFNAYYYKFTDILAAGLTAPDADKITVKIGNSEITHDDKNLRVKVDGQKITVSFEDIKKYSVTKDTVVTVEYSAVLNASADIGLEGNENKVSLSYLNNPNVNYNPDTSDATEDEPNFPSDNSTSDNPYDDIYNPPSTPDDDDKYISHTPEDKVIVFTYQVDITKKSSDETPVTLKGAKFKLNEPGRSGDNYVKLENGVISWVAETAATEFVSGDDGTLSIPGLDDGTYILTETKAPDGYNLPVGDNAKLTFKINAGTVNGQDWEFTPSNALTDLSVEKTSGSLLNDFPTQSDQANGIVADTHSGNAADGTVSFTIFNTKGATLPSTGGMGTTIFLLTGGTAAGAAAILYITKKRTSADSK